MEFLIQWTITKHTQVKEIGHGTHPCLQKNRNFVDDPMQMDHTVESPPKK